MSKQSHQINFFRLLFLTMVLLMAIMQSACDNSQPPEATSNVASRYVDASTDKARHYRDTIQPLLNNRCVVCHGCYDAPCQLKLSSANGVNRGAIPTKVYDGTRLTADPLTRLFVDAHTVEAWREKGFFPVLAETDQTTESQSVENGVFYQMLTLKQEHPLPAASNQRLADDIFDFSLNRADVCPTQESFDDYADNHTLKGMPYALPGLPNNEHKLLTDWLDKGAALSALPPLTEEFLEHIETWETFFNGDSLKQQLVARYIYEHLFLADIYFDDAPEKKYFKLVRSTTPPGEPISIIATRRPFDDPTSDPAYNKLIKRVYYRLQLVEHAIVAKNHIPYLLNNLRMQRFNALFFDKPYEVTYLPDYRPEQAANPFETFAAIPENSRYRFMLEQSKFTIRGFMKGAVCRGQVALNVINDHFWVFFADPENELFSYWNDALPKQIDRLDLPAERSSNAGVLSYWTDYSNSQAAYVKAKSKVFNQASKNNRPSLNWIWQGDGHNQNASLTVFRHFDSASVVKGLVGTQPKTAWLIDYPILERIHYLLVAGFDVYGNGGHQLATRLYMDFLRMESEFNFLALLPKSNRVQIRDYWYRDADKKVKSYIYGDHANIGVESAIDYTNDKPVQDELYQQLQRHLVKVLPKQHLINNAQMSMKYRILETLHDTSSRAATLLPEMSLVTIVNNNKPVRVFTILRNSGHSNITSLFQEKENRLPEEDYLTVIPGIVGAYPDALWRVEEGRLAEFIKQISALETKNDYAAVMDRFGIRRTHQSFWGYSDELHAYYQKAEGVEYGILDYNRLENR